MLQLAKKVRWSTKGIFYHGDGQDEEMKEKRKMESQLQTNPGKCSVTQTSWLGRILVEANAASSLGCGRIP